MLLNITGLLILITVFIFLQLISSDKTLFVKYKNVVAMWILVFITLYPFNQVLFLLLSHYDPMLYFIPLISLVKISLTYFLSRCLSGKKVVTREILFLWLLYIIILYPSMYLIVFLPGNMVNMMHWDRYENTVDRLIFWTNVMQLPPLDISSNEALANSIQERCNYIAVTTGRSSVTLGKIGINVHKERFIMERLTEIFPEAVRDGQRYLPSSYTIYSLRGFGYSRIETIRRFPS